MGAESNSQSASAQQGAKQGKRDWQMAGAKNERAHDKQEAAIHETRARARMTAAPTKIPRMNAAAIQVMTLNCMTHYVRRRAHLSSAYGCRAKEEHCKSG